MSHVTRLEAIVLGLLVERPAHGYELKARLGPGLPRERRINDGILYPLLGRLERRGLATGAEERSGGRSRRVYSATAAGEAAFDDWLIGDRDEGTEAGYELFVEHPLVKLLFASRLGSARLGAKIDSLLAAARDRLAALDEVPETGDEGTPKRIGVALLAVGRAREEALIAALEGLREDAGTRA
jgi:DNA-binding PadR family transcriptional regulator